MTRRSIVDERLNKIGDALSKRSPRMVAIFISLFGAEDLEVTRLGNGGFESEDTALFVVELDRVSIEPVLDTDSLGAMFHITNDFSQEATIDPSMGWNCSTEKAHDIRTGERLDAVLHQVGFGRA